MADIWFISDTHFCHQNILGFRDNDGKRIRDQWVYSDHMDNDIIDNWNSVVKPQDKVYHLGDVACGVRNPNYFVHIMNRLNGHKRLELGNHDNLKQPAYRLFERIELWTGGKFKKDGFVACHIPLRHDQMRDGELNVHGHIHQNVIADPRYMNVCVEQTGYKPVHIDEIKARRKKL